MECESCYMACDFDVDLADMKAERYAKDASCNGR